MVFRAADPGYADELLTHAEQLYEFADAFRGRYSDCITDAANFYRSWSGYADELVWGAIWLYRAKHAVSAGSGDSYLDKAELYYDSLNLEDGTEIKAELVSQTISQLWNGTASQAGSVVTV